MFESLTCSSSRLHSSSTDTNTCSRQPGQTRSGRSPPRVEAEDPHHALLRRFQRTFDFMTPCTNRTNIETNAHFRRHSQRRTFSRHSMPATDIPLTDNAQITKPHQTTESVYSTQTIANAAPSHRHGIPGDAAHNIQYTLPNAPCKGLRECD